MKRRTYVTIALNVLLVVELWYGTQWYGYCKPRLSDQVSRNFVESYLLTYTELSAMMLFEEMNIVDVFQNLHEPYDS